MWTKSIALSLAAAAAAATFSAPASAQVAGWAGRYVWEEDVGRRGGAGGDGITAFITYTLSIGPGNGATGCMLEGEGLQTNKQIQCTVTPRGNAAVIKFYGYGPDNMFRDGWARGQALFTLTRRRSGITTTLQGLRPSNRATPRTGKLFHRAR